MFLLNLIFLFEFRHLLGDQNGNLLDAGVRPDAQIVAVAGERLRTFDVFGAFWFVMNNLNCGELDGKAGRWPLE